VGRIVQNIGGIANLTAIPAGAPASRVTAFDTGPGNMVIDSVMERLFGKRYDRDGKVAAAGTVDGDVVVQLMRGRFFREKPPKTAGREEFGRDFAARFVRLCGRTRKENVVATATAFTARSIADAARRFVLRRGSFQEMVVSGGGTKNPILMAMLANELKPSGVMLRLSDEFGIPSEAKEAVAFALMAYETWHLRPSNVPSATGATRAVVLGKVSYV
jgi:anhydro-N-acetylmuramic acid kinase